MKKQPALSLINLFVMILVAIISITPLFPSRVLPVSAAPDKFSAARALEYLPVIAKVTHRAGSPEQILVREFLFQQLTDLGLEVEVQATADIENVIARLRGTEPGDAILIQAHYDSYGGPGAADNGAGVAALLEIMRSLTISPAPRHDIIALFADSEELPDPFTGTKAFIRSHPWMEDVRVAISMDTAVGGFISTNDTGEENGWMVKVLARAYTNGAWTSLSGGGNYDSQPFKIAGVRVLQLEDNYPFPQQHTENDLPAIVRPGSLQQLGEQALNIIRAMDPLDLEITSGLQQSFMYIPYLVFVHYPQSWALPLAGLSAVLFIAAYWLALRQKACTWKGLGVVLLAVVPTAAVAAIGVNALWKAAPKLFDWNTNLWSEWPEVIPPHGWLILSMTYLLVLILTIFVYRLARNKSQAADFSFFGLLFFQLFTIALAAGEPKGAIITTWPVLTGSLIWLIGLALVAKGKKLQLELVAFLAALPATMYLLPLLLSIFMGDGTKSVMITAGVWVVLLAVLLPGIDGLIARRVDKKG